MAEVKSLSIRGIRSFGPDDSDEQRISFDKPLTLILGQNGCGKTTIIECLRYAVTGQMPPGSRNECFVHDTKVNRSTEVLAQIKLKISNAKEKQLDVTRSMKVSATAKKPTFKTLDSCLSVIDENGKAKDLSSRCADLDLVMHEELGVSKAIINSVVFCHQEDSNWPLDEGKKVKERFDEIFDADKYSDCFERLRKMRKEFGMNIKLLDQEVSFLTDKKVELDKKKLDMVNTESQISENEIKSAELNAEIKPIADKLKMIVTLQKDLAMYEGKKEKIKSKMEINQVQIEELKKAIKTLFEGTTEELDENIKSYNATVKSKQEELVQSRNNVHSFNNDEHKTVNEMSSHDVKINRLMLLESQNQDRIDKRNQLIIETGNLSGVTIEPISSKEDAAKGIDAITFKVKTLMQDLATIKSNSDVEEKQHQQTVDGCRDALSRHKQKIVSKDTEIKNTKKEMLKIEKKIKDANESQVRLENIEKKLNEAEVEYQKTLGELDPEEAQKEINQDEKVLEQHEKELDELNDKISKLQSQTAKLKERDLLEDSFKNKEKQYTLLKNKHKSSLTELLGDMPEKDFAVTVNKFELHTRKEVDSINKKLKEKQNEVTRLEADRKHSRELLNGRRSELTAAEDKMYKACGTQPYETTFAKLNANVEKLQEEQNLLKSTIFIAKKYKEQLKENNCCPLCNRGFEGENEAENLITDLTNKVMNVPAKLESITEELQKTSAKKDDLLTLKTLNDKIRILKEEDIPTLETRLSDIDKNLTSAKETADDLSMAVMEPEQKLQTAKQIQGDMPLLDRYIQEIQTVTKELEAIKGQCSDLITDISLEDAESKRKDLKQKVTTVKGLIKTANTNLTKHNKKLQAMVNKKNQMKEEMLQIQKKVQEVVNLQENLKQLEANHEKFLLELKEFEDSTPPLETELKEKENERNAIVMKNRAAVDTKQSFISEINSAFDKVKTVEKEIRQHDSRNVPVEINKIKDLNSKLMEKKMKIMRDRDELTKRIDILKEELAKQEIYKRDLEDNYKLRKSEQDIANGEKELAEINEKLSGINLDMLTEQEPLIKQQTELFRARAEIDGGLKHLKTHLNNLKVELMRSENKDLENRFREKFYELHVSKALDKDIKEYATAMENCLLQFHRDKMANINLIIREMWRKIYRGNDIDYIEIKADGSLASDSDRRKYDYRVVQCKNGVEIDMRGRCSAGQKVLACLIIRLALAETFSSRFGMLALDEPTTNLDEENVRSLCVALAEIVQERMRQKNFMFIIITHDKEFIESLGSIDKVSHYYEVSRNDDGKSRIKKIRFM